MGNDLLGRPRVWLLAARKLEFAIGHLAPIF
jgi:hypothetical protein